MTVHISWSSGFGSVSGGDLPSVPSPIASASAPVALPSVKLVEPAHPHFQLRGPDPLPLHVGEPIVECREPRALSSQSRHGLAGAQDHPCRESTVVIEFDESCLAVADAERCAERTHTFESARCSPTPLMSVEQSGPECHRRLPCQSSRSV